MGMYEDIKQRNFGVYSKREQEKIRKARVTIVGVGCDGGMDAYMLARIGIGHIRLVDFDVNEMSNLNRQPAAFYDKLGKKKVDVARLEFSRFNPEIEIEAMDAKLTEENASELLKGSNVVIQGMDSIIGRIVFHRAAKKLKIPAITMTGQPPFRSFVSAIMPNGPLYEELFGIEFAIGKEINAITQKMVDGLRMERAEHSARRSKSLEWYEEYAKGNAGWGITPERAYLTSVYQCNETLRILTGKQAQAIAPRAIISDINGLEEFGLSQDSKVAVLSPPNGKNWDFRWF